MRLMMMVGCLAITGMLTGCGGQPPSIDVLTRFKPTGLLPRLLPRGIGGQELMRFGIVTPSCATKPGHVVQLVEVQNTVWNDACYLQDHIGGMANKPAAVAARLRNRAGLAMGAGALALYACGRIFYQTTGLMTKVLGFGVGVLGGVAVSQAGAWARQAWDIHATQSTPLLNISNNVQKYLLNKQARYFVCERQQGFQDDKECERYLSAGERACGHVALGKAGSQWSLYEQLQSQQRANSAPGRPAVLYLRPPEDWEKARFATSCVPVAPDIMTPWQNTWVYAGWSAVRDWLCGTSTPAIGRRDTPDPKIEAILKEYEAAEAHRRSSARVGVEH